MRSINKVLNQLHGFFLIFSKKSKGKSRNLNHKTLCVSISNVLYQLHYSNIALIMNAIPKFNIKEKVSSSNEIEVSYVIENSFD